MPMTLGTRKSSSIWSLKYLAIQVPAVGARFCMMPSSPLILPRLCSGTLSATVATNAASAALADAEAMTKPTVTTATLLAVAMITSPRSRPSMPRTSHGLPAAEAAGGAVAEAPEERVCQHRGYRARRGDDTERGDLVVLGDDRLHLETQA